MPAHLQVEVSDHDINDVDADVVAVPIDARLRGDRRIVQAVLAACDPALAESLARLAAAIPTGVAPGAVVVMPAVGHRRFRLVCFVVLFDNRDPASPISVVEPGEARIELAAAALWRTLADQDDGSLALVPFAGRLGDTGEAAATVTRIFRDLGTAPPLSTPSSPPSSTSSTESRTRRVVFVERDSILRRDIRAGIESIGVAVGGVLDDDNELARGGDGGDDGDDDDDDGRPIA